MEVSEDSVMVTATVDTSNQLNEYQVKYEQSQLMMESLKEQLAHSNSRLNELGSLYETSKQNEADEKTKTKHLERSVRALKIEKDQLFTVRL